MKAYYVFSVLILLIAVTSARNFRKIRRRNVPSRSICNRIHLEILVSPIVLDEEVRRLTVQWDNAPAMDGDWIGLFTRDPLYEKNLAPDWTYQVTSRQGWTNTSVFEDHIEAADLGYKAHCLNYYTVYFDKFNSTLTATCLRTEPSWMWDLRAEIGNKRIKSLFIPGTHDSAAYGEYDPEKGDSRVKKYVIVQDEPVLGQLIYGVRYLDLRIGYYKGNREQWWGNHGVAKVHPLRIILRDIKTFLDFTNEVVILDIQEFPVGFDKKIDIHRKFVQFLREEIGDYCASPTITFDGSLNEIWQNNRRLIVSYDYPHIVQESSFLWPSVSQQWGNVQKTSTLYLYLKQIIERPPFRAWSAMAQLTPKTIDVLLDRFKGLRSAAEMVNHNVTEWYRKSTWAERTNIVAVDFVRGTGIVRAAIEWNKFHGSC